MSESDSDGLEAEAAEDTVIWFGKHAGERFGDLPRKYRLWCLYSEEAKRYYWYDAFWELNERHELENPPTESPANEKIGFGKSPDTIFALVYKNKGWMRWHQDPKRARCAWYYELFDLEHRYELWLQSHRRKYHPRAPTELIRDVGDLTGPWDDDRDRVDPDEEYAFDDVIVPDDGDDEGASSEHTTASSSAKETARDDVSEMSDAVGSVARGSVEVSDESESSMSDTDDDEESKGDTSNDEGTPDTEPEDEQIKPRTLRPCKRRRVDSSANSDAGSKSASPEIRPVTTRSPKRRRVVMSDTSEG